MTTYSTDEDKVAWTPDLFGPIYKKPSVTLREVLLAHRNDRCTRTMATFVPDELIYETDLSRKNFRKFNSVVALFNVRQLFNAHRKYTCGENGGSYALVELLNRCVSIVIEEVYSTQGDVLKFSQDGLLVMWKVNRDEFVSKMVYNVILCSQQIQESVSKVKSNVFAPRVNVVVSAGEVTFSVIGDDATRHYVIGGTPIDDIKLATRICLPGDLVLSSSAWDHCAPSQYEYVIKDSNNVKIVKVLGPPAEIPKRSSVLEVSTQDRRSTIVSEEPVDMISISDMSVYSDIEAIPFHTRVSVIDALRRRLGSLLKTYMLRPILIQIENEEPLEHLTEARRVTVVSVDIIPGKCSVYELISLVDEVFRTVLKIISQYSGCISTTNLYDKDMLFYILYGVRGYDKEENDESNSRNGILSAAQIMKETKRIAGVKSVLIGISTGMAFCGVIGHVVRRQYMIFGTPIDKAVSMMMISFDRISCDYDAFSCSSLSKEKFRSRGVKVLRNFGRCYVYEFLDTHSKKEMLSNLEYSYPILDRFQVLEYFKDILDDIGVSGRNYSGMVIEGAERSGKSRLLDAFVAIALNRQIKLVRLSLHPSFTDKAYAVLYHVFVQLFDAHDCTTNRDREKFLLTKLSDILMPDDFCYLNVIMRVQFPLSRKYCEDTDWKRYTKTIEIFERILNEIIGRVCILLDDVQYMDLLSWQFLSFGLSNDNVVLVATLLEPVSWDNLSSVEAGICQDKRLMNRSLVGLDSQFLAAFACQFLNVLAIPKSLEKILQVRSKNSISWCEAFLMSALQVQLLKVIVISPMDAVLYDLVFPDSSLLAKIPAYLTPEEVAPPLHWSQMSALNVCVPTEKPLGFIEPNRDVIGLRVDIYNRMNSYEQDFIKCAAMMGTVFLRRTAEKLLINSAPLYTRKAVAEMIRLRILQCAMIQRKYFHEDDSVYYVFKKRKTFSNMHHLVTCDCRRSYIFTEKNLPPYAHCKILEFSIVSYRKLFYDILAPHEKEDYHTKVLNTFERDARKCSTCGGGSFVTIYSTEESKLPSYELLSKTSTLTPRRGTLSSRHDRMDSRRTIFVPDSSDQERKRDNVNIRRISILPVHVGNEDDEHSGMTSETGKESYQSDFLRKQRRVSVMSSPEATFNDSWDDRLKEFSYVDYRNCRCNEAINYVFWTLHYHLKRSKDTEKMVQFVIEYGAGLIQTAQPIFATKFLAAISASIKILKLKNRLALDDPEVIRNKGKTLILMGDAYLMNGNYAQAKKFYTEAVSLRGEPLQTGKAICYNAIVETLRRKFRGFPDYNVNRVTGDQASDNLELGVYLQRYANILMLQDQGKVAKLTTLQALRAAFECAGGFLEKGRIYLTALQIFQRFDGLDWIEPLERTMMYIVNEKTQWKSVEEITIVARVFETMYKIRLLQGELDEGIEFGIKTLKICSCLHVTEIQLAVLPSLIEIMIWTKHLNEAVDLLRELYYLSNEDIDYSAITWYYALNLECVLDAGMVLESFDACYNFYRNVMAYRSRTSVLRDPESLSRLITCLVIWQLRMNMAVSDTLVQNVDVYIDGITYDKFSQIYNCVKGLECYLLILKRRINIKKSSDLFDRVQNTTAIVKTLQRLSTRATFVKPFLYLLQAYMELLRGRKGGSQDYVQKSQKWSSSQGNKMMLAWIEQNKRTWKEANYNNMAHYWVEHLGTGEAIRWQEIHSFDLNAWSTILFPLPVPDSTF